MVARKDLGFTQICVQACHAVIEVARNSLIPPELDHPHLVLCGIENEQKLYKTLQQLTDAGIVCKCFYESDLGNQLTAIATQPLFKNELTENQRKVLRRLQLLKNSDCQKQWLGGAA